MSLADVLAIPARFDRRLMAQQQLDAIAAQGGDVARLLAAIDDPSCWTKGGEVSWTRAASRLRWTRKRLDRARARLVELRREMEAPRPRTESETGGGGIGA